jgi:HSP20 family molecular chaperone IbpA|uniref:SHSP domain-containing protein n=1 Tax=viral metagenome TaxID=1070528 RepID=A0A6C0BEQ6_9ZZZZ
MQSGNLNDTFGDIFIKALNGLSTHPSFNGDLDDSEGTKPNFSSFVFPLVKDVLQTSGQGFGTYDIIENDQNVRIVVDLPGVEKKDIKLEIEKHGKEFFVKISTERLIDQTPMGKYERFRGKFSRSIPISAHIDQNSISASCTNGVLCVTMQKTRGESSKTIPIL